MRHFFLGLILSFITMFVDQWSKYFVFVMLKDIPEKKMAIMPFVNFVMVENQGVSFGMFNQIPYAAQFLSGIAIGITVILLVWMWQAQKLYLTLALSLVIGGAVGNIIDRVRYGAVFDFIDVYISTAHWPAFNIADSAILLGVARIFYESFIKNDEDKYVKVGK